MRGGVVEEDEDRGGRGMDVEIRVGSKRILIYMYPEIREIRPLRLCSAFSTDNSKNVRPAAYDMDVPEAWTVKNSFILSRTTTQTEASTNVKADERKLPAPNSNNISLSQHDEAVCQDFMWSKLFTALDSNSARPDSFRIAMNVNRPELPPDPMFNWTVHV
ncbi:hypothetical protein B0H14DRAFT_2557024 [Mycena olivaceomarginata]|nr:hypothetical protein B0H14DRAFT_2557024 [Mycena olivaceomarginata]